MSNLYRKSPFNDAELDPDNLARSLLIQAQAASLLDEAEADRIRLSLLELLSCRIWKYTGEKSYSIRQETAEELLQSLLFTLDTRLSLCTPEDALNLLETHSPQSLFDEGLKVVKTQVEEAKAILTRFSVSRQAGLIALNNTLDKAIPDFFKDFDPDYFAHRIPALIDYPLLKPTRREKGIAYIREYLGNLLFEEQILSCWNPQTLRRTLAHYGKANEDHYPEMMINAAEILLCGAAGAVLAGRSPVRPYLSAEECAVLQQKLVDQDPAVAAVNALRITVEKLNIVDTDIQSYIYSYAGDFAALLSTAVRQNALFRLLPSETLSPQPALQFQDNPPMPDYQFNWLVNRLTGCGDPEEKAAFIRRNIKSLYDLADLFEADCLYDGEYEAVFRLLEDIELAALLSRRFEPPADQDQIALIACWQYDSSSLWQPLFARFLSAFPSDRLESVLHMAGQLTPHS